jgi:azurin
VRLVTDNLREGFIHEVKLSNMASDKGVNLIHPTAYYTMNAIPGGDKAVLTETQKVQQHHHAMEMPAPVEKKPAAPAKAKVAVLAKRQTKMPSDWKQPDQVIVIGTKPGLKYDVTSLQVKAGTKIKLVFNNNDDMSHNVVVVPPDKGNEVGDAALTLGLKGAEMQYVPNSSNVLYHTNLIQPGTSESIYFIAPSKPGDYIYLCTYPGHAALMRGVLKVVK